MQLQTRDALEVAVQGKEEAVLAECKSCKQTVAHFERESALRASGDDLSGPEPRIPIRLEVFEGGKGGKQRGHLRRRATSPPQFRKN